jgi:hypothetical protein
VAKALADSARTTRILAIRGGILEGSPIGEEDVKNLATLPPLDVLRGQVLGAITAPLMTVVGLISAPVRDLLGLIDARIEQLKEQGDTSGAEAEAPAEPESFAEGQVSDTAAEASGESEEVSDTPEPAEAEAEPVEEEPAEEEAPEPEAEAETAEEPEPAPAE